MRCTDLSGGCTRLLGCSAQGEEKCFVETVPQHQADVSTSLEVHGTYKPLKCLNMVISTVISYKYSSK